MLEIRNLKRYYQMGSTTVHALDGINLSIEQNEFVAIMGSSGSGKSTLMNILGCLDTPTSGSYVLNGNEVEQLNDDELAEIRNSHLGFVFQSFNLLPRLTTLKNAALPLMYSRVLPKDREEKARKVLESVGLGDRINHKPTELSGGEMQRVAVARALINEPDIILADEPTGNLDTTTAEDIMALLVTLFQQGQTIIMVTHEKEIADHANRVIYLRDGKIISDTGRAGKR